MTQITLNDQETGITAEKNPAMVYLANLTSATSRRTQAGALQTIAQILNRPLEAIQWHKLTYAETSAIRTRLIEAYAPATVNKTLSALRGTLKNAWRLGYMSAEDYHRAADLDNVTIESLPTGRDVSAGELSALINACQADPSAAGTRDAAIIGILYVAGLRRAELAALTLDDIDPDTGRIEVINGKRNKSRAVYINNGALDALKDWLKLRGQEAGPLFYPINKGGNITPAEKFTSQAVYTVINKRAKEAKIKSLSPHDLRRSMVGALLDAGADLATVSNIAGHSDPKTTAKYDRRPEEAKAKAASLLHIPYTPKG